MSDLTLGEIGALDGVRSLLAEATRRTGDRSVGGRHVCVVLLDGAVEACLSVCLGRFGEAASDRDTLADLYKRLERHTSQQRLPGWREASRLRRIRNLTHHHQVPVDSETLADLVPAVSAFVDNAIRATFGIRLTDVTVASAISSDELQLLVQSAESSLAAGDTAAAVDHAGRAFRRALAAWSQHRQSLTHSVVPHDNLGLGRAIDDIVSPTRALVEMLTFAPDQAEAMWFDRLLRLRQRDVVGHDDAQRAIRFAVDWIVRWEAYELLHRSYLEGERQPIYLDVEPSSSPDGRPEFVGTPVVTSQSDGVLVSIRMRWGTDELDESGKRLWHRAVTECLNSAAGSRARLGRDGLEVYVSPPDGADLDAEQVVSALREIEAAFAATPDKIAQAELSQAARESAAIEQSRRNADLLAAVRSATGAEFSPFVSIDNARLNTGAEGGLRNELRFGIAMPAALSEATDRTQLPLGTLRRSGAELVWVLTAPPDDRAVVGGAKALLENLEQRRVDQHRSREHREHGIQAIAVAVTDYLTSHP